VQPHSPTGLLLHVTPAGEGEAPWTWLDLSYFCSFIKMGVTLVKYIPQVHLNLSRQSTEGWSIDNVLLDLGGGVLSLAQLFVSCMVLHDWSAVTGNPIKMGLGMASLGFDVIFILQHYVWYREAGAAADTSEGVLSRKSSLEHEDHLEPLLPAAAVSHAHALV
jgi:cystinosin